MIRSLLTLMREKPFASITVIDLVNEAGYSRRTFYRHFSSLEDVLRLYINGLTLELFTYLGQGRNMAFETVVLRFFSFWKRQAPFLWLLQRNGLLYQLQASWLGNIDQSLLSQLEVRNLDYVERFSLGGMYALLSLWIDQGFSKSPKEMSLIGAEIRKHLKDD